MNHLLWLQEGNGIGEFAVEVIDEHGEASELWRLHKPPSQELWMKGQVHIKNEGDRQYSVKKKILTNVLLVALNNSLNRWC